MWGGGWLPVCLAGWLTGWKGGSEPFPGPSLTETYVSGYGDRKKRRKRPTLTHSQFDLTLLSGLAKPPCLNPILIDPSHSIIFAEFILLGHVPLVPVPSPRFALPTLRPCPQRSRLILAMCDEYDQAKT